MEVPDSQEPCSRRATDGHAVPLSLPLPRERCRCRELSDRGQLVGLRARRTGEAVRAVGDALEAPDLAGVGEGVPADAEALCLGSGEDALRC